MIVYKGFKTKIYPNKEQIEYFNECFGISRFAYNWYIEKMKYNYENGIKQNFNNLRKEFQRLKYADEYKWLQNTNVRVINSALGNANDAFKRFFNKQCNYPKFKSKKYNKRSFSSDSCSIYPTAIQFNNKRHLFNGKCFYIGGKLSKPGTVNGYFIKTAEDISFLKDKQIYLITISYDGINYYASFSYKYENNNIYNNHIEDIVGIDLGLKTYAVQSDNRITKFPKQRVLKLEQKIRRLNQIMSKKEKGSKNYNKVRTKLNKCYKKIHNITLDFLHKYTTYLCKTYKTIKIEDLNISGMLKNHKLARSISRSYFYTFRSMLEYKSKWYNNKLIIIDRFYPSSKTCHCCGNIKKDLKLSDRIYKCNKCDIVIDRDLNAALNIRDWNVV